MSSYQYSIRLVKLVWFLIRWSILIGAVSLVWLVLSTQIPATIATIIEESNPHIRIHGVTGQLISGIEIDELVYQDGDGHIDVSNVAFKINYSQLYRGVITVDELDLGFLTLSTGQELLDHLVSDYTQDLAMEITKSRLSFNIWNQSITYDVNVASINDNVYYQLSLDNHTGTLLFKSSAFTANTTMAMMGQWDGTSLSVYGMDGSTLILDMDCGKSGGGCSGKLAGGLDKIIKKNTIISTDFDIDFDVSEDHGTQVHINQIGLADYTLSGYADYQASTGDLKAQLYQLDDLWVDIQPSSELPQYEIAIQVPEFNLDNWVVIRDASLNLVAHESKLITGQGGISELTMNRWKVIGWQLDLNQDATPAMLAAKLLDDNQAVIQDMVIKEGDEGYDLSLNAFGMPVVIAMAVDSDVGAITLSQVLVETDHGHYALTKPVLVNLKSSGIPFDDVCLTNDQGARLCIQFSSIDKDIIHITAKDFQLNKAWLKYTEMPVLDTFLEGKLNGYVDLSLVQRLPVRGQLTVDDMKLSQHVFISDIKHLFKINLDGTLFTDLTSDKIVFDHRSAADLDHDEHPSTINGEIAYDRDGIKSIKTLLNRLYLVDDDGTNLALSGDIEFNSLPSYWKLIGKIDLHGEQLNLLTFDSEKLRPSDVVKLNNNLYDNSLAQLYDVDISLNIQQPIKSRLSNIIGDLLGSLSITKQAGKFIRVTGDLSLDNAWVDVGVKLDVDRATFVYQNDPVDNPFIDIAIFHDLIETGDSFDSFEDLLDDQVRFLAFGRLQYPKFQLQASNIDRLGDFVYPLMMKFGEGNDTSSDNLLGFFSFFGKVKSFFNLDRLALRPVDRSDAIGESDFSEGEVVIEKNITDKMKLSGSIKKSKESNFFLSLIYKINSYLSARLYSRSGGNVESSSGFDLLYIY